MQFVLVFSPTFGALQVSFSTNHVPAKKPVWTTVTVNIFKYYSETREAVWWGTRRAILALIIISAILNWLLGISIVGLPN